MADGAVAGPVDTEALPAAPPCDFRFFSSILKIEVWLEEDEAFIRPEMSDALIISEGGTLKPVGCAIPSGVRER
jgi:hypothetical protein